MNVCTSSKLNVFLVSDAMLGSYLHIWVARCSFHQFDVRVLIQLGPTGDGPMMPSATETLLAGNLGPK